MPFGLANAGAVFSRFIDEALQGLTWNIAVVYADDVLVFTKTNTVQSHIQDLDAVFARLEKFGITVKGSKLQLGLNELPFLGQIITKDGFYPDPAKTRAIAELEPPNSIIQLRRVCGMFAHYSKYIPNFSEIARPLYEMCGKNNQHKRNQNRAIIMNKEQQDSFNLLKERLVTTPVMLHFPDLNKPFTLDCDASKVGIAAILSQGAEEGKERVVCYASQALTTSERNYSAYQAECLAAVWAMQLFRHYIKMKPFRLRTDCHALQWLQKSKGVTVTKWLMRLQEFDYKVEHRPGKLSANVDALTRQALQEVDYGQEPFESMPERAKKVNTNGKSVSMILKLDSAVESFKENQRAISDINFCSVILPAQSPLEEPAKVSPEDMSELPSISSPPFFAPCDKEGWKFEDWIHEQTCSESHNSDVSKLREQVLAGKNERFKFIRGLLVKEKAPELNKHSPTRDKIVVPRTLRAFILGQHHSLELAAHQGYRRTVQSIGSRYYWPGMKNDCRRWIKACSGCTRRKTPRPMHNGLCEIRQSSKPWEIVGIDLVVGLNETERGNKWILTITDCFTRWPIAIPLPDRESSTIARAIFEELICHHGRPDIMVSDQGRELISKSFQELCKRWGVRKVATGGYNPKGNAACERFHLWLNFTMTTIRKDNPNWDDFLQAALFAYRTSINDATGYSPHYLLHMQEATLPSDLGFEILEDSPASRYDYVEQMTSKLKAAFKATRAHQYANALYNEGNAREKVKPDFKRGDELYVWTKSADEMTDTSLKGVKSKIPTKWTNPWVGPFPFVKWVGERRCEVLVAGRPKIYHCNRLTIHTPWDAITPSTFQ